MDALLENKPLLAIIAVALVAVIAVVVMGQKKAPAKAKGKAGAGSIPIKAGVVWNDASEGAFDQAFDYAARKEIKNSQLRYHMQTIVEAWSKRRCGAVIVKHPNGREMQVVKFKTGHKVSGKPFLGVDYVSFTSDRRRVGLFMDGVKSEELECEDIAIFEMGRKCILNYTQGGRKTCSLSNLAFRESYVAPMFKE